MVAYRFFPKILGGGRDLQMVLCHSMNTGSVMGIPYSGEDTQTLPYAKQFEIFALTGSGVVKTLGACTSAISHAIAHAQKE